MVGLWLFGRVEFSGRFLRAESAASLTLALVESVCGRRDSRSLPPASALRRSDCAAPALLHCAVVAFLATLVSASFLFVLLRAVGVFDEAGQPALARCQADRIRLLADRSKSLDLARAIRHSHAQRTHPTRLSH